ncbi:beta-N-acetylhexosaminidase [Sodaliphilus sp.]|uniref:beta-N-acetylhexosaminidase n=1 Tax=Sodaliphilus sp. TaxID=2815818 RepID=UPI00388F66BE
MKQLFLVLMTLVAVVCGAGNVDVVPAVRSARVDSSRTLSLGVDAGVWAAPGAMSAAKYLVDYCHDKLGLHFKLVDNASDAIITINDVEVTPINGYLLTVDDRRVSISSVSPAARFYGVTTLIQMLPSRPGDLPRLPHCTIVDAPGYDYRGMHLDVVRHFYPVSFVKQYIDWMALHKMNVFHWHLTDDQGWRIALKSHPELTERGSSRDGEIKGIFPGEYYDRPYQAYYTQEEIKDVISYAEERFVTVVPEIDIPGHCMAVLAAHPEFSTSPDSIKHTALTWGIFNRQNNVLAPSDEVFKFLDEVFDEVCQLFPGKYIHVGGDECAPRWWNESTATQQYMEQHGLQDAHALQTHFMQHVQAVCRKHGKVAIGWDGGAEGMDPADGVVESWHVRPKMPLRRIDTTHKWINASGRYFYFTCHEDSTQTELAPGAGRTLTVRDVYESQLVPDSASVAVRDNLLGVEGCLWTEYCAEPWKAEMMVFPRIAALAEKAWCGERLPGWNDFQPRLLRLLNYYDLWRIRYNPAFERTTPTPRER